MVANPNYDSGVRVRLPTTLTLPSLDEEFLHLAETPPNMAELLETLDSKYPGLKGQLTDPDSSLALAINGKIQIDDDHMIELHPGDEVEFLVALSGG